MIVSELKVVLSEALNQIGSELQEISSTGGESSLGYLFARGASTRSSSRRSLFYLTRRIYGDDEAMLREKLSRLSGLCDHFLKRYGDGPVSVLRAPARINILGEHVDYVSYLPTGSLTFGSREHDMTMLCRASETGRVRGASTLAAYAAFDFEIEDGPAPSDVHDLPRQWLSYLQAARAPTPHWGNYVKGALFFARLKYGQRAGVGFDFIVDSAIPPGGGASSSSALIVLAGAAIRSVNKIEYDPAELAEDSAQAEWYVGTRGGAMDHLTICLARQQKAVHISYADGRARSVPVPDRQFCWVTFFSHMADKGREVMLEYNERAAVSRVIIPAIIERWRETRPELYRLWKTALEELPAGSESSANTTRQVLNELPLEVTLAEMEREYTNAFRECSLTFPALVRERRGQPLKVRDRALHHVGEVRRVTSAVRVLRELFDVTGEQEFVGAGMRAIGELLDESHQSLCGRYEVCTPEAGRLVEIIAADPQVYGARLMGGGFGGNVLALTTREHLPLLIDRVQSEYYGPQGREGLREGSVMVSTPGPGLSTMSIEAVWREAITHFNARWWEASRYQDSIGSLLDGLDLTEPSNETWPIIVAAGKGTRASSSGLNVPKPLALISGVHAITRVLHTLKASVRAARPPIVIVSPETAAGVRQALAGEEVIFVVQPEARGTGDAVLHAREQMRDFRGRVLVVWGTQPVIRARTLRRTWQMAKLFADYEMVVPTAVMARPYAPLLRDHHGHVRASQETHLERVQAGRFGETNIGLFIVRSEAMFEALLDLRRAHWHEAEGRYDRPGGEFGFPNELITHLSKQPRGVLASPIADWREQQGIKNLADISRCEQFIAEMGDEMAGGKETDQSYH